MTRSLEWSQYQSHSSRSIKLISKQQFNSKCYRKYDVSPTPYRRVLASDHVSDAAKEELETVHQRRNSFISKKIRERNLRAIGHNVKAISNVRQ